MINNNLKDEVQMIEDRILINQQVEEEHYKYLFNEIDGLKDRIKELEQIIKRFENKK